jgi:hypothetical protein
MPLGATIGGQNGVLASSVDAELRDHDIARLEIAVNDALPVGLRQRLYRRGCALFEGGANTRR